MDLRWRSFYADLFTWPGPSPVLHDSSLVVNDLPAVRGAMPNGRPPCQAFPSLQKRVRKQVGVHAQLAAVEISRLPNVLFRLGEAPLQLIQHKLTGVSASAGAGLPEVLCGHSLKVCSRGPKLGPMKYRFKCRELGKHILQLWRGGEAGFQKLTLQLAGVFFHQRLYRRLILPGQRLALQLVVADDVHRFAFGQKSLVFTRLFLTLRSFVQNPICEFE